MTFLSNTRERTTRNEEHKLVCGNVRVLPPIQGWSALAAIPADVQMLSEWSATGGGYRALRRVALQVHYRHEKSCRSMWRTPQGSVESKHRDTRRIKFPGVRGRLTEVLAVFFLLEVLGSLVAASVHYKINTGVHGHLVTHLRRMELRWCATVVRRISCAEREEHKTNAMDVY